jgi:hypothetical protein
MFPHTKKITDSFLHPTVSSHKYKITKLSRDPAQRVILRLPATNAIISATLIEGGLDDLVIFHHHEKIVPHALTRKRKMQILTIEMR